MYISGSIFRVFGFFYVNIRAATGKSSAEKWLLARSHSGVLLGDCCVRYFGINHTTVHTASGNLGGEERTRILRWWYLFVQFRLVLYGPIVACERRLDDINWYNGPRAAAWWTCVTPVMATQTSLMTLACSTYAASGGVYKPELAKAGKFDLQFCTQSAVPVPFLSPNHSVLYRAPAPATARGYTGASIPVYR